MSSTDRISRRRVPADADERVKRCSSCGSWTYDRLPCTTCAIGFELQEWQARTLAVILADRQ